MKKFLTLFLVEEEEEIEDTPLDLTHYHQMPHKSKKSNSSTKKATPLNPKGTWFTVGVTAFNLLLFIAFFIFLSNTKAFLVSLMIFPIIGGLVGFLLGYYHLNIGQTTKWLSLLYLVFTLFKHQTGWTLISLTYFVFYFTSLSIALLLSYLISTLYPKLKAKGWGGFSSSKENDSTSTI